MAAEKNIDCLELSDITYEGIEEVLKKQLNSNDIDIVIEQGSKKGDNYLGIVYRVTGKIKKAENSSEDTRDMKIIVKVAPRNEIRREQFNARSFFIREIKVYSEIFSAFHQFQESRGIIPEVNGFHEIPLCYKAVDSDPNETLILEDLRDSGYEMFDRLAETSIDHVLLVVKALGKFHAISFALRDQNPELLKKLADLPELYLGKQDSMFQGLIDESRKNAYDSLTNPSDDHLLKKLKDLIDENYSMVAYQCVQGNKAEPYAVICHGDCWTNNILFRNDENGKPIELKLLDFQLARYASPVTDLVFYLFCSATKNIRDKYYDEILRAYHNSLSEMIEKLGSDPVKLFPYEAMLDQLQKFGIFGLTSAIFELNFMISAPEDCVDMDELALKLRDSNTCEHLPKTKVFYERMRDVVIDCDRLGYF